MGLRGLTPFPFCHDSNGEDTTKHHGFQGHETRGEDLANLNGLKRAILEESVKLGEPPSETLQLNSLGP